MIYEARIRLSAGKRKWMFTLSRNGRTIFVSDHSYHTRESAIRAARRRAMITAPPLPVMVRRTHHIQSFIIRNSKKMMKIYVASSWRTERHDEVGQSADPRRTHRLQLP